jgi:uncharacterized protein
VAQPRPLSDQAKQPKPGRAEAVELSTPHGPARAHLHAAAEPRAALVLGHGAGGGVEAPDLIAARDAALGENFSVALVELPYRVAGRRSPPRIEALEVDWIAVLEHLGANELAGLPLLTGGRSMGARIACRTAAGTGSVGVLCLAFPLSPPARAGKPRKNRQDELDAVNVPALVVQGERDMFGMPPSGPARSVVVVPGDHGLKADRAAVGSAVGSWLARLNM